MIEITVRTDSIELLNHLITQTELFTAQSLSDLKANITWEAIKDKRLVASQRIEFHKDKNKVC